MNIIQILIKEQLKYRYIQEAENTGTGTLDSGYIPEPTVAQSTLQAKSYKRDHIKKPELRVLRTGSIENTIKMIQASMQQQQQQSAPR